MTLTFDKNVYGSLLAEYQPKVIASVEENSRALEAVENLMACKNRTPEQNALLKLLVTLIEDFEDDRYQLQASTPHSILKHLMEARDLTQFALIDILESQGITSEMLEGDCCMSKTQAEDLGDFFHVSPRLFLEKSL